jgi:hypothetical protein
VGNFAEANGRDFQGTASARNRKECSYQELPHREILIYLFQFTKDDTAIL